MAVGTLPVQSDPTLLEDIRRYGKFDPTGCYQCGSCTLSCELASDFANFPRKSIRYSLLGLRAPLLGSLEPWICHDCGECSTACPRHAEPRISMKTLRRFLSAQYEWTGLAGKLLRSRAWHLGALAFSAVFVDCTDPLLPPVVCGTAPFRPNHTDGVGAHVPHHHVLHAHSDALSAASPVLPRPPRLAAHHGQCGTAFRPIFHLC